MLARSSLLSFASHSNSARIEVASLRARAERCIPDSPGLRRNLVGQRRARGAKMIALGEKIRPRRKKRRLDSPRPARKIAAKTETEKIGVRRAIVAGESIPIEKRRRAAALGRVEQRQIVLLRMRGESVKQAQAVAYGVAAAGRNAAAPQPFGFERSVRRRVAAPGARARTPQPARCGRDGARL